MMTQNGGTVSKEADAVCGGPRWVKARSRGASSRVRLPDCRGGRTLFSGLLGFRT